MTERKGASMKTFEKLTVRGVSRDGEDATGKTLAVFFNREPSDDELRDFHDNLRAQAAAAGASMTEPVAWQAKQGVRTHYLYDKISADYAQANGWKITPLYAHPAPAPAEHTAAEKNPEQPSATHVAESQALALSESSDAGIAPRRDGGGPEGVPDVAGLTHKLLYWARSSAENRPQAADAMREAADALAALQSQLNLRIAHGWIADAAGKQQDDKIKQQADRIKELEALSVTKIMLDVVPGERGEGEEIYAKSVAEVEAAMSKDGLRIDDLQGRVNELKSKLAEAVGLLEEALPSIETVANSFENTQDKWHAAFVHRIKAAIDAAREG